MAKKRIEISRSQQLGLIILLLGLLLLALYRWLKLPG